MRRALIIAALPLGASAALALALALTGAAGVIVFARADLATLSVLAGTLLSALALAALLLRARHARAALALAGQARAAAEDDRRRFLQRLDHELKNPLMAVRAGLANLGEPSQAETVASIDAQVQRLARLSGDLRKLAEMETRPLERAPVDLAELLGELVEIAGERPGAEQRRLLLTLPRAPWPLQVIQGDRDLLFLALYNLVENALKFTAPGDTIEVRAFEDGAAVAVEVADTGPGIAPEDLEHIWEELYRARAVHGTPGSGIGLALVRAITLRHGGQVAARSRVGQGTVFTVRLPG